MRLSIYNHWSNPCSHIIGIGIDRGNVYVGSHEIYLELTLFNIGLRVLYRKKYSDAFLKETQWSDEEIKRMGDKRIGDHPAKPFNMIADDPGVKDVEEIFKYHKDFMKNFKKRPGKKSETICFKDGDEAST